MGGGGVLWTAAKAATLGSHRAARGPWLPQRVTLEADEWEFAGGEEERLCGVAPPSLEEAKEAASDLKDALHGLYSPNASTGLCESYCSEGLGPKLGCAAILASSAHRNVMQPFPLRRSAHRNIVQAFSLLQEFPEVQDIVASLARDKKVWDAVMKNKKVMDFCKTHKINAQPQSSENGLRDFLHTIRLKVKEMMNSFSDLFENLIGTTGAGSTTTLMRINSSDRRYEDMAVGASFIALTIATIILILLKRE